MNREDRVREYGMLFLNLVTPLHNGSGEGLGIIDNPIMRERITQFPIIQASSIKGVLRDAYEEKIPSGKISQDDVFSLFGTSMKDEKEQTEAIIGNGSTSVSSPKDRNEHAGAISFGDGQILAFPVRSVKGCFVWVTSPLTIWRFYQKINLIGLNALLSNLENLISLISDPIECAMICSSGMDEICIKNTQKIYLEEYPLNFSKSEELEKIAIDLSKFVYPEMVDSFLKKQFEKKLVLLDDNVFTYFINNATEVIPNIKIGKNGTTEIGSLRYTEFLPAETIMYSALVFDKSRRKDSSLKSATDVKGKFEEILPLLDVQIGGDETTGKGIVKLSLTNAEKVDKIGKEGDSATELIGELENENSDEGGENC